MGQGMLPARHIPSVESMDIVLFSTMIYMLS
jgi:hypothetical protein